MIQEDLFKKIKNNYSSDRAYIIELLKFRGFLFEELTDKVMLSDNSHDSDREYLGDLLTRYNLGYIVNNEVVITNVDYMEFIQNEFREGKQIGIPSCWQGRDWRYFKRREHGEKVAVSWLEPFIARYIKAISACCVLTVGSCDGNHSGENKMFIMTEGEGSVPWHKLICEKCLVSKYDIDWINDYTAIQFSAETKFSTYYEVNKAAEFLYSNRKEIRRIKDAAFCRMSNGYLKHRTTEEIKKEFIERAAELFDSSNL